MRIARISCAVLLTATTTLFLETTTSRSARGADFDGSRNLLCAPSDVVECDSAARCERESVADIDLPNFIHVQFGKKRLVSASGEERSTTIQNFQNVNGLTILQGAENGRAWSVVIDQASGRMSGSIADSDGAFSIFGACLPE
ncbi:MAG TPA: hypothetical protein VKM54_27290 [Myxococcota bacterium]|nr:hypothetical protein [Myxococcota bacterium]